MAFDWLFEIYIYEMLFETDILAAVENAVNPELSSSIMI